MSSKFSIWMLCFAYLWCCSQTAIVTETRSVVVKNVNTQGKQDIANKQQQPIILALETDDPVQAWEMYHQLQQAFANETSMLFVDIQPRYIVRVHARPSQAMLTKIVCGYKQFTKSANKNIPGVHSSKAENIYIPDYTLSPFTAAEENGSSSTPLVKRGWPLEWRALWLQFC